MEKPKASTERLKKYQNILKREPYSDVLNFEEFKKKDMKFEMKKLKSNIRILFLVYLISMVFLIACIVTRSVILHA